MLEFGKYLVREVEGGRSVVSTRTPLAGLGVDAWEAATFEMMPVGIVAKTKSSRYEKPNFIRGGVWFCE